MQRGDASLRAYPKVYPLGRREASTLVNPLGLGGFPHERYPKVYPLGLHQEGEREKGK
ncbi:MAG: hypothetical protein HC930_01345 [Hydrococcus sp. SU_1_0]|nr:hypothetical protein [Hydrococcus sp. SU_1_0]